MVKYPLQYITKIHESFSQFFDGTEKTDSSGNNIPLGFGRCSVPISAGTPTTVSVGSEVLTAMFRLLEYNAV
jgi:hypothetical protein